MSDTATWLAAVATVAILVCYEIALAVGHRRRPGRLARSAHAALREEWFAAVSAQQGSEILAVQTLRNSVMSATMTASTAALALMGTATLAAPSLHSVLDAPPGLPTFTVRLALEFVLMGLLFSSLLSSVMAVRYYNHAGFIGAMPVGSEARDRWTDAGRFMCGAPASSTAGAQASRPRGTHPCLHRPPGRRSRGGAVSGRGASQIRPVRERDRTRIDRGSPVQSLSGREARGRVWLAPHQRPLDHRRRIADVKRLPALAQRTSAAVTRSKRRRCSVHDSSVICSM